MRILVAGANGQVGQNLVSLGPSYGHDIIGLNKRDLDIASTDSVASVFTEEHPALVINAAAYTAVDKAESDKELAFRVNELGPKNLAQMCAEFDIPLIHISTDYVFSGLLGRPYIESDSVEPIGVYARSKEAGERHVRDTLTRHIILRVSWVFSKEGSCFPKAILNAGKKNSILRVVDDQIGGPTSAKSIAQVLLLIARTYADATTSNKTLAQEFWGTYHFSQLPYVSWYQFAQEVISLGKQAKVIDQACKVVPCSSSEYPTPVTRPANSRLNIQKILSAFQLHEPMWQHDLKELVEYFARIDT